VQRVAFSPDQAWLATAGSEGEVTFFDAADGARRGVFRYTARRSEGEAIEIEFSPQADELALACEDGQLRFVSVPAFERARDDIGIFLPSALEYSSDGRMALVTGLRGGAGIKVFDLRRGGLVEPQVKHANHVTASTFSDDVELVVSGSVDRSVYVWETATGRAVAHRSGLSASVSFVAVSPGGDRRVLSALEDGSVLIWPIDPLPAARARQARGLTDLERERERKLAEPLPFD